MTDFDLENLKNVPVPAARPHAKRAALDAAMNDFDKTLENPAHPAGSAAAESDAPTKDSPKGNITALRQTETSTLKRSFRMYLSSRTTQAMAASLAALVIAAPFAFQHLERLRDAQPPVVQTQSETKIVGHVAEPNAAPLNEQSRNQPTAAPDQGRIESERDRRSDDRIAGVSPVPADANAVRDAIARLAPPPPPSRPPSPPMSAGLGALSIEQQQVQAAAQTAAMSADASVRKKKAETRVRGLVAPGEAAYLARKADGVVEQPVIVEREEYRDQFDAKDANPIKQVASEPVSTFSTDVDTASYGFVRRALNSGHLPPKDAVRIEEMINYFPYAYPAPDSADVPFKPTVTVLPSPWNTSNKLVHVAIKGYDIKSAERPRANLVFLIDVSGSMAPDDRLPLLKNAFRMLVDQLKADDTVAIVTYASGSGVALEPTKITDKAKILAAIDRLGAGGSTAGAAGIADAYRLAEASFDKSAVNRVVLATDGDFNVGITDQSELRSYIERKRQSGIFLSILGVGQGNHNDALMQTLAQNGNGTAAYVDTLNEARKVLVDEASSTLFTIAKDVKAQIEWNPARVSEYRLIGYETRVLRREDFNNDAVDAGDIGSGHTVTAIYEVTPVGAPPSSDALRYGKVAASDAKPDAAAGSSSELGFLKLRYKRPNEAASQLISLPVTDELTKASINDIPAEQRFSIAVAAFAQLLKDESAMHGYTYDDVIAHAQTARGDDPFGYRAEFLNLVRLAKSAQP
ncbi:MAG: VWA domain-containing protein [Hyphomicrobium sp.]|nr:VWA domain-containing protein [Hyphomicrobium sp.]